MVGSKDYFDLENDGNVNVTLMPRQPGSAIKVVNYAYALSHGYTPATLLADTPVTYKIPGSKPYSPKNYDGKFHGFVSLRTALASSYNVPAVKVLASYGVDKMIKLGKKMGITTWDDPSRFGLSLTLGGGEVKMIDMAVVYGVLANQGKKINLNPILKVTDYKGRVLEGASFQTQENNYQKILDPGVAFLLTNILTDNHARTPAFGPNSLLVIPGHPEVAVKTGTTQNLRDNWCIGYTPSFVVVVWVGNNDNSPMSWVASGITGATPIWHKIMSNLLKDKPQETWRQPSNVVKIPICALNGLLPCPGCPLKYEYFLKGTEPQKHCLPDLLPKENSQDKLLQGVSTVRFNH
jgi:membrane carboxypeptidase/penicillin-binding protein